MPVPKPKADSGHRPDKPIIVKKTRVAKGVNRGFIALPLVLLMAGCQTLGITNASPTPAATIYAVISGYEAAENLAATYESSPTANPAIVNQIKAKDASTYAVVQPLAAQAAGGNNVVTAAEVAAAQAAVSDLSNLLASNGVK